MKKVLALVVAISAAMAVRAVVVRADVNTGSPAVGQQTVQQDDFSAMFSQDCSVATAENSAFCSEAAFCSQNVSHPDCQMFCVAYPSDQACAQQVSSKATWPGRRYRRGGWCARHPLNPGCWI